jgi:hypothetical protein
MKTCAILALLTLAVSVPAARGQDSSTGNPQGDLPQPGFGTLNQNDIALTIRQNELEIRLVPLDERLLRLLAADAYTSLHGVIVSRSREIDSVGRQNGVATPGLLLVTFFGRQPGARFNPENVDILIRNQLYRPIGVIPYSPNFNSQQLDVRQQAAGIFLYEVAIPVFESFSVSYGPTTNDDWEGRLNRLQRERSRVMNRARSDSSSY